MFKWYLDGESEHSQWSFSMGLEMLPDAPVSCQERDVDVVGRSRSGAWPSMYAGHVIRGEKVGSSLEGT